MTAFPERRTRLATSIPWLLSARWAGVAAQVASVIAGRFLLDASPPLAWSLPLIGITTGSNVIATMAVRRLERRPVAGVMALILLDAVVLTALLSRSGGAMNPLSIMYLVYITLAAVMLNTSWTWIVTAACMALFGLLFLAPESRFDANVSMATHMAAMRVHLLSMWWSLFLAAIVTAHFGARLSRRLDQQNAALAAARAESERNQRLAALTTLAAGAAHELSSPLGTIAVAAEELGRTLARTGSDHAVRDDLELIQQELARCRKTLDRMALDLGATVGEGLATTTARAVAAAALGRLPPHEARRVLLKGDLDMHILVPAEALSQALTNLVRNALEADPTRGHISVTITGDPTSARFVVKDSGLGMPGDVLDRAGEPFFTTKPPGRGMGLGIFLTRAVVEQLGGTLRMESLPGAGTTATMEVPLKVARA